MNRSKMSRTGANQYSRRRNMTYASIRINAGGNILRTKVSLDTEPVDSSLGNAILEAIDASGVSPTGAVVTLRFS